ncbi:peptidoglycan DD-metalloendopeptidase family protein [Vibrio litoralis]|uniref:peptidoglycan DD-metalloendopeptidase family protein n=1 Tax=Vibrio litoralis TaxID=335972 RepID=UPI00186807CA|nr:peptidoglycan DD-metalloendopeptidase family protein [Vibrio litoralis]
MYNKYQKISYKKQLRLWAWLLLLLLPVAGVLSYYFIFSTSYSSLFKSSPFSLNHADSVFSEAVLERNDPSLTLEKDVIDQQQTQRSYSHKVQSGETLADIFKLYGLSHEDLLAMIKVRPQAITLLNGQVVEWVQDDAGSLLSVQIHRSARLSSLYTKVNNQFLFRPLVTSAEKQSLVKVGIVGRNFYQSARAIGLTQEHIQTIATALYWQVDVTSPITIGDKFSVELEQSVIGEQSVGASKVMAIWYQHRGKDIQVVRFNDEQFYYPDGISVEKTLDRLPLRRSYPVSSEFNPHRLNPVTHQYAPHYGTDLATPIGTPVYATGEGVVKKVGYHPLAGKYVVISNGRVYSTHFFHLSQALVKVGDRVKRGQKIALTGNTGRSTGPHLHYELRQNGQPLDAMLAPLPRQKSILREQRAEFTEQVKARISLLH